MKILCTICARKGSKEIVNKNLLKLGKKLLIDFTIEQAKKSNMFDKIVISTDSKKIKELTKKKVDLVIKRPSFLSRDKSPKIPAIKHSLLSSENFFLKTFDLIVDLDVTSPLRDIKDIKNSIKIFKKKKSSNLVSVTISKRNPYFNMIKKKGKSFSLVKKTSKNIYSRQTAPKIYELNASIYIWNRSALLRSRSLIGNKTTIYEMPAERSIDIDSKLDLSIVKHLILKKKN